MSLICMLMYQQDGESYYAFINMITVACYLFRSIRHIFKDFLDLVNLKEESNMHQLKTVKVVFQFKLGSEFRLQFSCVRLYIMRRSPKFENGFLRSRHVEFQSPRASNMSFIKCATIRNSSTEKSESQGSEKKKRKWQRPTLAD